MAKLSFLFLLFLSVCIAQLDSKLKTTCKDCRRKSLLRYRWDQECSLGNTAKYQPCLCDANCTILYGDCCPSTNYSCLSSDEGGEESVSYHCQHIVIGIRYRGWIPHGGHYWRVSTCSSKWLKEMGNSKDVQKIVKNCTNQLDRIVSGFHQ